MHNAYSVILVGLKRMKDTPAEIKRRGSGSPDCAAFGKRAAFFPAERSLILGRAAGFFCRRAARPAHQNICVADTHASRGILCQGGARDLCHEGAVERTIRFRRGVIFVTRAQWSSSELEPLNSNRSGEGKAARTSQPLNLSTSQRHYRRSTQTVSTHPLQT